MGLFGQPDGGGEPFYEDIRRRNAGPAGRPGGGGGIGGAGMSLSRLLPYLLGLQFPNQVGPQGPQGLGLGVDNRNAIGGPNAAPGNPQGFSNKQPGPPGPNPSVGPQQGGGSRPSPVGIALPPTQTQGGNRRSQGRGLGSLLQ